MSVNAMIVSAGEALDALRTAWQVQKDGHMLASYMLHGRPGVGKTQVVEQLARDMGGLLFDLRLTTIEPQDLRGLPYYDHQSQKTKWYRPEDLPDDPAHPAILFLDELTAASPMLQPTVYGLLQERRVGRHRLPDSVFIVAAGNTVEDGAIAYQMNTALSDRLIHLHVQAAAADWLDNYAVPKGLHPTVVAFIKTRADLLDTTEQALEQGHLIATTPRSWERVSQIMQAVPDRRMRNILVAGTVGDAVAAEFALIADDIAATVQVQDMLEADRKARIALYPASMHGLNALIYGLIGILDARNVNGAIDIMADIRQLARLREEDDFKRMPLGELCTYGFEGLIRKGLELGIGQRFLAHDAYKAYAKEREAAGLA
ncbi:MoxR-like ATPase [Rhodovulum sp. P5]|uniref:AAA family ATPase n=1 Tax=Rhodovulum sp. P5 TaxID=1564506 RepID=UPI0009C29F27|nr:MoxR family ATPase [Rhodovulum sp. P5]ARE40089.1 MoxR-like ATPase [Rhodovulum sp. P5]